MYYIEKIHRYIGRFRLPSFEESMRELKPGDEIIIGGQKITVGNREPGRQTPTKLLVGDREINLEEKETRRFPPKGGDQFIEIRHVRVIE